MKKFVFMMAMLGACAMTACSAPNPADRMETSSAPWHDAPSEAAAPLDAVFLRISPPQTDAASFMRQYANLPDSTDDKQPSVVCLSSQEELAAFTDAASSYFELSHAYGVYPAFSETVTQYDAAFFEENRLAVLYIEATSGSVRYEVSGIRQGNDTATILLKCSAPAAGTCDMAYWLACVPISCKIAEEDMPVCAQISSGTFLGMRRITDLRP